METVKENNTHWLDKKIFPFLPNLSIETFFVILLLIVAIISRFYMVDARVMSHDEVNHVVPSYDLYQGLGYAHDPITHGPLQFHLLAASYFVLGDSDFSARVPAVLFSIATVAFVIFAFRRYLGRTGTILAGLFFTISPFLLFYGRYTRNEAFVGLFAVTMLYAVLRYLERGDRFSMILLTVSTSLHFTSKETAYMYVAEMLIFLGLLFLQRLIQADWKSPAARRRFFNLSVLAIALFVIGFGLTVWTASLAEVSEDGNSVIAAELTAMHVASYVFLAAFLVAAAFDIVLLVKDHGWKRIRAERSFDLMLQLGTLVLPLLVAFPIKLIGWNPLDYSQMGLIRSGVMILFMFALSAALGYWWDRKRWGLNMIIFYAIFIVFYTTFFTNGRGFFTGLVGSLGYWLDQQSVERGSQPLYYYLLIQMPIYEYLGLIGTAVAVFLGLRNKNENLPEDEPQDVETVEVDSLREATATPDDEEIYGSPQPAPTFFLLLFWSAMNLIAFSISGEKMPWLTFHIAIPFLLTAAWGVGQLIDRIEWKKLINQHSLLALLLFPVFLTSLFAFIGSLFGSNPPFQGKELEQLQATNTFLMSLLVSCLSGLFIFRKLKQFSLNQILRLAVLSFMLILTLLTARTAYMANYINYDYANEFLVYAHASPAPKEILRQIEEISYRTTGGNDIVVSYDNDGLYPYWWYFRDYPNANWYTDQPTRELTNSTAILASTDNYGKVDSIVKDNYVKFEYIRLWWPMQDYFNLSLTRVIEAIGNPAMRSALWQIWLNRDYTEYAAVKNNGNLTLETWSPSDRFRLYLRKDIVSQIWEYGTNPNLAVVEETDPYLENALDLLPDQIIGSQGSDPGQLLSPRGMAIAPDGSIYVADSRNHRIQRFAPTGELIASWGTFADAVSGSAPGGTFNEPWDVAVDQYGNVFVADTWNHRVQKFTADGNFITMWGVFGTAESDYALWGPRSIVVDDQGYVYVTDTGNKRIVVYTNDGEAHASFGSVGFEEGQFDEPVGLALSPEGVLYVADTWNMRVQGFAVSADRAVFTPIHNWDFYGWFSQSLENKPYLAVAPNGNVFVTDPEGYRVVEFDASGAFIRSWGDYSAGLDGFGLSSAITVAPDGGVWVSDAGNHRLLRFTLPE
ncbi:MAG: glycosyltransferase family 39 protein [Anaerolineaceae bacterium]|nr:glycosyltransferase family 39 protein [Anaerolineaceae bacterium]